MSVKSFIDLTDVTAIEIHDSNNNKKWIVNQQSLRLIKDILAKSYYTNQLLVKPGHLSIKFIGPQNLKSYIIYMYNDGIYFDPFRYRRDGKLKNKEKPVSIVLTRSINWAKLK
ncbi:hypothetical protein D0C36_14080 [Mucilaginibacter conchicola]|uniref:Uncharacterized protein n=1 Tax=Mucilaginibacter conchicola TaxID=2303333 RepID=A0A372NTG9_9SPHI|nr:hypothetical protein D0C36_14080 [Mucilaginibacter conchicola]